MSTFGSYDIAVVKTSGKIERYEKKKKGEVKKYHGNIYLHFSQNAWNSMIVTLHLRKLPLRGHKA